MNITLAKTLTDAAPIPLQRAEGTVRVGFKKQDGSTVLGELYQAGCAKALFPRITGRGCEAVLVNTAGGLTDGDILKNEICWAPGTSAAVTTQACERIYRSRGAPAHIETSLEVEDGAHAFWLPQETILFDAGRLQRTIDIRLSGTARFTACEAVILGRPAMGEIVSSGAIRDFWQIRRDEKPLFVDRFAIDGALTSLLKRTAIGNGATAWATIVHAAPDAAEKRDAARALLHQFDVDAGFTDLGGIMVARILGADGFGLRKAMVGLLSLLCGADRTPQNWTC